MITLPTEPKEYTDLVHEEASKLIAKMADLDGTPVYFPCHVLAEAIALFLITVPNAKQRDKIIGSCGARINFVNNKLTSDYFSPRPVE